MLSHCVFGSSCHGCWALTFVYCLHVVKPNLTLLLSSELLFTSFCEWVTLYHSWLPKNGLRIPCLCLCLLDILSLLGGIIPRWCHIANALCWTTKACLHSSTKHSSGIRSSEILYVGAISLFFFSFLFSSELNLFSNFSNSYITPW